jgi:CRP-like cAMP-binding protein
VLRAIPKEVLERVRAIPLFSTCSTNELREIAKLGSKVSIAPGVTITAEDTVGKELLIILDGTATCRVGGRKLATFGPGDFFGEMSLLDKGPRSATVTADTDMEFLVLDGREFHRLIQVSPTVAWKMLVVMARRLRSADTSLTH